MRGGGGEGKGGLWKGGGEGGGRGGGRGGGGKGGKRGGGKGGGGKGIEHFAFFSQSADPSPTLCVHAQRPLTLKLFEVFSVKISAQYHPLYPKLEFNVISSTRQPTFYFFTF